MQLSALRYRLDNRLLRAERLFVSFAKTFKRNCSHDQLAFLDGLLSYTWQAWCRFCRDLVVHSCIGGAVTSAGVALAPSVNPPTVQRVSFLAMRAKLNKPATPGLNPIWRNEPTWGDVSVLGRIIALTAPANEAQLSTVFGGVVRGPAHLQKVRNACAHLNDQTLQEVLSLRVYYLAAPIRFPCEAAFWLDANDGDFAFVDWVGEMRNIALSAVS